MHRIAFDPSLPVVAAQPFMAAGRSFASGEQVDWRALGISEQVVYDWWRTGCVSHPVESAKVDEALSVAPAASVDVRTSKQKRAQRSV